jgi:transcriptional regulator with PAS, ATPase and Fis domain
LKARFGTVKGSYYRRRGQPRLFEQAQGGRFRDEINSMETTTQVKNQGIDEKTVRRVLAGRR